MLEGVPMTLKDNMSTKGIETTCCSKILSGYKPIYDATVWTSLKEKGAVLLGKTNMDEFAMGSSCETSCYGAAKNPRNTKFVAGGSSGGGASAVGGNLAVYAAVMCGARTAKRLRAAFSRAKARRIFRRQRTRATRGQLARGR